MIHKVALGTVQFGLNYGINNKIGQTSKVEALKILQYCKEYGVHYIDTAAAYGNSEQILGELLSLNFNDYDFNLTTKFKFVEGEDLFTLTRQSLQRLKRHRIENQLFHSFSDYKKFAAYQRPNEIERWGVSVYSNKEITEVIEDANIKIIQCPFNLLDNDSQRGLLLRKAKSKGIEVQVRSAFLQGLFFVNRGNLPKRLTPLRRALLILDDICRKYDLTMQELALGYCVSRDYVDKVVIGVDSLEQLQSNLNAMNKIIPAEAIDLVDNIEVQRGDLLFPNNW